MSQNPIVCAYYMAAYDLPARSLILRSTLADADSLEIEARWGRKWLETIIAMIHSAIC